MKDNLSIIITMVVLVLLMIIFPLYNNFERQDDMSYNVILKSTTLFVDEVLDAGYLDQKMYDEFVDKISNTGNIYDIELEAHKRYFTNNPGNESEKIEQYIIDYNNDIFSSDGIASNTNDVALKNDVYYFNEGDKFYVRVKNRNTTMAEAIFSTIVPSSKKGRINANYGGIIKNVAWKPVESTHQNILNKDLEPKLYFENTGINGALGIANNEMLNTKDEISIPVSIAAEKTPNLTFRAEGPLKSDLDWWQNLDKYIWSFEDSNGNVLDKSTLGLADTFTIKKNLLKVGLYKLKIMGTSSKMGYTTAQVILNIKITGLHTPEIIYVSPIDLDVINRSVTIYAKDSYDEQFAFRAGFTKYGDWRDNADEIRWAFNEKLNRTTSDYYIPANTALQKTNYVSLYRYINSVGYSTPIDTFTIKVEELEQTVYAGIEQYNIDKYYPLADGIYYYFFKDGAKVGIHGYLDFKAGVSTKELERLGIDEVRGYFVYEGRSRHRGYFKPYIGVKSPKGDFNSEAFIIDNGHRIMGDVIYMYNRSVALSVKRDRNGIWSAVK